MKNWNEMSYWLRGGVTGIIIGLILFGIIEFLQIVGLPINNTLIKILFYPSYKATGNYNYLLIDILVEKTEWLSIAGYFILGALIGWICGKIKKSNEKGGKR